jgi:hypothetical protein
MGAGSHTALSAGSSWPRASTKTGSSAEPPASAATRRVAPAGQRSCFPLERPREHLDDEDEYGRSPSRDHYGQATPVERDEGHQQGQRCLTRPSGAKLQPRRRANERRAMATTPGHEEANGTAKLGRVGSRSPVSGLDNYDDLPHVG